MNDKLTIFDYQLTISDFSDYSDYKKNALI